MTAEVWVAIVSTFGIVIVALISNRGRQHAKAARAQVENSHDLNLRDDLDEKHRGNVHRLKKLDELVQWQGEHQLKSDRGYKRLVRLELVIVTGLVASVAGIYSTLTRRKRK